MFWNRPPKPSKQPESSEQSEQPRSSAPQKSDAPLDPYMTWLMQVVAADLAFQEVCGPVDPEDLQQLISKRMLQYAAYNLKRETQSEEPGGE